MQKNKYRGKEIDMNWDIKRGQDRRKYFILSLNWYWMLYFQYFPKGNDVLILAETSATVNQYLQDFFGMFLFTQKNRLGNMPTQSHR